MSKTADEARARAALFSHAAPGTQAVPPQAAPDDREHGIDPEIAADLDRAAQTARQARTVRTRKVRRTLDMPPARHAQTKTWQLEAADTAGAPPDGIDGHALGNALFHLLLTDVTTRDKVIAVLREHYDGTRPLY